MDEEYLGENMEKQISKNALWGSRTYLPGPIDRIEDQGIGHRALLIPFLHSMNIITLDPTSKSPMFDGPAMDLDMNRDYRERLIEEERYNELSAGIKELRHLDLRMVDITDFSVCSLDILIHMCGTYEEIFTGNRQKKPILVNCLEGKKKVPHWMFGVFPHQHFFESAGAIKEHLEEINNTGKDPFNTNRWILFDWKKIHKEHL